VQVYDRALGRARQVGTYATRREAKAAEAGAAARSTMAGRETIASFAARWLVEYPRPRVSTTLRHAERVKTFVARFGRRRLDSITVPEARTFAVERRGDLPSLRAMFNDARSAGAVTANPFANLRLPQPRGRRDLAPDWLKAPDIEKLADAALTCHGDYGPVFASLVRLAAYSGMRHGELFGLQWDDLDGDFIYVRRAADSKTKTIQLPKNGRQRTIVLLPQAREAALACPRLHDRLVFTAPRGGPLWQPNLSVLWKPVKCAAGRPEMDFYESRHFCATHLLELGVSHADVAVQLGHTDGGRLVMSTYGHPSEDAARARIKIATDAAAASVLVALGDRKAVRGA
jgi:integrase